MTRDELLTLHAETCEACRTTMERKNSDYSDEDDALANFGDAEIVGVEAERSVLVRCVDKFKRITSYLDRGDLKVKDEPVEDAIHDVINYMVLLKGLLEDR